MKFLMRIVVVALGLIVVLGTFSATRTVAVACGQTRQGTPMGCFGINYECSGGYDCQGMVCVLNGKCSQGLTCVPVVCVKFNRSSCYSIPGNSEAKVHASRSSQ
jgi:hypothetical protein